MSKQVFRKKLKRKVKIKFLRANFANYYNLGMNLVDRSGHLRKNFHIGRELRNQKWWSIFFWGFDVAMVKAYLCYKVWHEMHQLTPVSH